ncbi:MAG TPA: hypothetical protein VER55_09535, partial [Ardenticatenaceae bacterium]|nr:hypothetical protein [Ardenticatenaceae bacterium]
GALIGPAGGSFESADGRIRVEVPAGALTQTVQMSYTPGAHPARGAAFYTFDLSARTAGGAEVTDFAQPLTVTLRYTDRDVAGLGESSLRLAWTREAANGQPRQSGQWPSSVYTQTNTLVAQVSHFSEQQAEGEPHTIVPTTINDFQVGLFSGSASFGLPLDLPPGAAGLKPALTLRYDSSRVNEMYRRYSQAGWVGVGWGLDLGTIRWIDTEGSDLDYTYSLNMEGLSGPLLYADDSTITDGRPGRYRTKRESFARIELVEGRYSEQNRNMGRWEITTKDGTRYAFGSTANSRMWSCRGTEAWKLDTITDTAGNVLRIQYGHPPYNPPHTYHTDHCNVNEGNPDEAQWNETYPLTMTYSTNPAAIDSTPEFTVTFGTSRRPYYRESESTILYETQKLDRITLTNAEGHAVREWGFRYEDAVPTDGPGTDDPINVLLKSIVITGTHAAGTSGATLPPMSFEYDPPEAARTLDWCLHGTEAGPLQRQYLRAAHNGYGGTVRFDYRRWSATEEDEETGIEYCANGYQVSERRADGGVAGAAPERMDSYGYETPLIFWDPAPAFIGFENATMTDTVGVVTDNQFYVNPDDPTAARNGVPRSTEVRVAGILRARQDYDFDFDDGKALLEDERRMETEPSGGPRYTRTEHAYDGYGNRTLTLEHGVVDV